MARLGEQGCRGSVWLTGGVLVSWLGSSLTAACPPALHDVGRFRVGSQLGEARAGFSGRPKVLIFTQADDPAWPGIESCLGDPLLESDMEHFTGVLVDALQEPDLEKVLRDQGITIVVRSLSGGVIGLHAGAFDCLDLLRTLQSARIASPFIEKSPIYNFLLERPEQIGDYSATIGCANAASFVAFFGEFEGAGSAAVRAARASLAVACAVFLRGDANADGRVDISDAVQVLGYLFIGEPATLCEDAADADDGGIVDISDAISVLIYLFQCSASPPPPPFPALGLDPTQDALVCG